MKVGILLCWRVFGDLGTSVKFSIFFSILCFDNVLACIFLIKTIPTLNWELCIASQATEILPKNNFPYISDFKGLTLKFKKRSCFFKNFMNTLISKTLDP